MLSEEQMHAGKSFLRAYLDAFHSLECVPDRQAAQKAAYNEGYAHWSGVVHDAHEKNEVLFDGNGDLAIGPNFRNNSLLKLFQFANPTLRPLVESQPCTASQLDGKLDALLNQTRKDLAAGRTKA